MVNFDLCCYIHVLYGNPIIALNNSCRSSLVAQIVAPNVETDARGDPNITDTIATSKYSVMLAPPVPMNGPATKNDGQ